MLPEPRTLNWKGSRPPKAKKREIEGAKFHAQEWCSAIGMQMIIHRYFESTKAKKGRAFLPPHYSVNVRFAGLIRDRNPVADRNPVGHCDSVADRDPVRNCNAITYSYSVTDGYSI
jgi:hypothetical protein